MEFQVDGLDMMIPAVVTVLIMAIRQFRSTLDGQSAYWFSICANVVAAVSAALVTGDPLASAALFGAGAGAVVSPGIAETTKRFVPGGQKLVTPRSTGR